MNPILRLSLVTLTAAGASPLAASPFATSAAGVGTTLGNKESASAIASRSADADWPVAKHTPSGQMFKLPFRVPKLEDIQKTASGWEYSGQLEFGYLGGDADERNAQYRMYQDLDQGAYLNNLSLLLKKADGSFVDIAAGAAGHRDQYYGLQFGRVNAWQLKLYFNETPHVFTDSYKSLWNGVGTGNLTLLSGLTPGGTASTANDNAAVTAAALSVAPQALSLTRQRYGARLDLTLSSAWKAYASYALEQRRGARPLDAVWGNNPGTAPIEIPEPIDYDTTDLAAGVQFARGVHAFNLRLAASLFKNNIDTLTFQEPYRIAPPGGVTTTPAAGAYTQGRFDLTPSNQAYNARAEYSRSLPDFYKGSFTAVVSAGTWRQDDNLIPYTTLPGLAITNVTLLPGGDWSTTGSLSRATARGAIDTRLVDLTLSLNPAPALNVKAKARYFDTDNSSDPYYAVNPNAVYVDADAATAGNQTRGLTYGGYTGVWGRLINDASGSAPLLFAQNANPTGSIVVRNSIYSTKTYRIGPTADYQLNKTSNLNFAAEREIIQRTHRERDRTWEDRYKLGYVNRSLPVRDTSLRASYEFAQRRGSRYVTAYYEDVMSAALLPMPSASGTNVTSWAVRNLGALRNYQLSDRDQHTANLRLDTMLRPNLDAGISLQLRESRYPDAAYGRGKDSQDSANLDLNYQPSPKQNIYAFYSYQQGRIRQATITSGNNVTLGVVSPLGVITPDNAALIGPTPGGGYYSLGNAWSARSTDRNHVAGAGLKQELGKATLAIDYSYSLGRTRLTYQYGIGGAINAANAVFAGNRMPDLATNISYLDASLRFPLSERLSARLVYRNQWEAIRDWHYRNIDTTPVVANNPNAAPTVVILDSGPMNYRVNWFGVMLQIRL